MTDAEEDQVVEDALAHTILAILDEACASKPTPQADDMFWRWVEEHVTPTLLKAIDEFVEMGLLVRVGQCSRCGRLDYSSHECSSAEDIK